MKRNILIFSLFLLFGHVLPAAEISISLDPTKIRVVKGAWQKTTGQYAGEKYLDYVDEENNVLFHALERVAPCLNCLIKGAKNTGGLLVFNNPKRVFFCEEAEVLKYFKIEPKKKPNAKKENFMIINPKFLTLNTYMNADTTKYFININDDVKKETEIDKSVFDLLLTAKNFAEQTGQDLKINFHKLHRPGRNPAKNIFFVKKVAQENECVVCQDKAKNTLLIPCKHLCVCDECGEKIKDICPLCRGKIKEKMQVF